MTLRDFSPDINKNLVQPIKKLSPLIQQILNSALDVVRPHFFSLGARVAILSSEQVEVRIPAKARNQDRQGFILPGVQISAAIEALRLLLYRNAPKGLLDIQILSVKTDFINPSANEVKIRGQLPELIKETLWIELMKNKKASYRGQLFILDTQDQIISEVEINCELKLQEALGWK